MPSRYRLFLALLAALVFGPAARAQTPEAARMDQIINADAAQNGFMGAVLVAKGDRILFDKAYGMANVEWAVPNSADTRFLINSISKQMTAAAILLLEEQGKLKLTDPVKTWWPTAPASWDAITIFNLLTHTSGIPDYVDVPEFHDTLRLKKPAQDRLAPILDKPLLFTPGEKFAYSNSNYLLLAAIVERAAGEPCGKFIQDNIFTPLGMKDSVAGSDALLPRRASSYTRVAGVVADATYIDNSAQPIVIYSTTHDMLIWEKALLGGKLLSPDSLKAMTTAFRPATAPGSPNNSGYGMGLYIGTTEDGRREISHTGGGGGFVAEMANFPDNDVTVILLSNLDTSNYADITEKLADVASGIPVILPSERKQIALGPDVLARYVGRYQLRPGFVVEFVEKDGTLEAHPGKNPVVQIFPQSQTSFFGRSIDLLVDFQGDGASASSLVWRVNGIALKAPRVE